MKKKLLFIFTSIIFASFILFLGIHNTKDVNALEIDVNSNQTNILNQYILGDIISLPDNIDVEYHGNKKATNMVIETPSGISYKASKIKFDETGIYKIKYSLMENNVSIVFVQDIKVVENYFNISSDNGSYIKKSNAEDRLKSGKQGIIASLAEDTTLYYNKVINLNDCDENGLSNVIEIDPRLGKIENDKYVPLQSKVYVVLTDCYDEKISVTLKMQRSENYYGHFFPGVLTYIQDCKGLDKGDLPNLGRTKQIILDGEKYRLWPDEDGSMNVGLFNYSTNMTTGAIWKYEPATKRFYLSYNNGSNILVTDLDEPLIYGNEPLFPGFTTGEVKLSIYANTYYGNDNARIEIASIGNDNVYDLVDNKYIDEVAPIIDVSYNKDSFFASLGETINIPEATIIDTNCNNNPIINVYTGYHTDNKINVSIDDNSFVANKLDLYTIEYKAIDKAGNISIKTIDVIIKETTNNQTIELSYDKTPLVCGKETNLYFNVDSSLNAKKEDVKVKIYIDSPRQKLILENEYVFTPLYDDEYTITYEYGDDIFTYKTSYKTKCERSNEKYFVDIWKLPNKYIKSFDYSLPHLYAYSFENGKPEKIIPNYFVSFDGNTETKIDNINKVNINGNNNVKFIARAGNTEYISNNYEIVDVSYNDDNKKIDMTKLFSGDFTANCTNDKGNRIADISFISNKDSGNNTLSFVNNVLSDNFRLTYRIMEGTSNFGSLTIKLTDFVDSTLYSTITIYNKEDGAFLSLDGKDQIKLNDYSFASNSKNTIMYNYYSSNLYLGNNIFKTSFNCPSRRCYIDIILNDIYGNSAITISQINNQVISGNNYYDNAGPEIIYDDFQGHYGLNDVVHISNFMAGDVLKGIDENSISCYIVAPNNSKAYDVDGNVLGTLDPNMTYDLKLTEIGNYYVIYKINDFNNKASTAQISITCIDTTIPNIKLDNMNDNATIIVKAGMDINIDFTISDNISEPVNMKAFIHLYCVDQYSYVPNISKIDYKNMPVDGIFKESFVINVKGLYEAQIHVYDEVGNESIKRINIIVE